jgi:hypothetical protein
MKYFRVLADDNRFGDRWFLYEPLLENGLSIDARLFRYGKTYEGVAPHSVPVQQNGKRIAFNLAAFDMPVVSNEVASILRAVAESHCEFFPVIIGDSNVEMSILNVVLRIECVDEPRCEEVIKWRPEDNRHDRMGFYRSIGGLRIDSMKTAGHHIFRIFGWEVSLIVSEIIRAKLEAVENLGIVFDEVT